MKQTTKASLTDFETLISQLKQSGTAPQKNLINALENYVGFMMPGNAISDDAGARQQYMLWKALIFVIDESPSDEFKKLWNIVLAFFEEYKKTVFHDRYVFRFSEFWQWSDTDLTAMQRIINIIKLTCNPDTRTTGIRKVDLNRSLETGISDNGRQKLVSFYKN